MADPHPQRFLEPYPIDVTPITRDRYERDLEKLARTPKLANALPWFVSAAVTFLAGWRTLVGDDSHWSVGFFVGAGILAVVSLGTAGHALFSREKVSVAGLAERLMGPDPSQPPKASLKDLFFRLLRWLVN